MAIIVLSLSIHFVNFLTPLDYTFFYHHLRLFLEHNFVISQNILAIWKFIPINYCSSCNGPVALLSVLSHIFLNQISFSKFFSFNLVFFQMKILHIIYYEYITHNSLVFGHYSFFTTLKNFTNLCLLINISSGSWILLIYHRYLCA